jgi:two-component system response regulator HydG
MKSVLIIEDDLTFGMMLKTWLGKKGFQVSSAGTIARGQKIIGEGEIDLVLSDLRLPDQDGIDLLAWMNKKNLTIPVIIMTGYAEIQSAVTSIKLGAADYIAKPFNPEELLKKITEALQQPKSIREPEKGAYESNFLEGESDAARQLYNYVGLVAPTNMSVLINGASGTGKEYIAHRIHRLSRRKEQPFVPIDCGAIPKELAASEFFGHIKGSFTGALTDKKGALEMANGGTVFLDEIGNLSYEVQVQLLRALQERKIRPVGSAQEIAVDIRLISATNENLEAAIGQGGFREDLFHRINEFPLRIPDLKERQEDILLFANFFLDQANRELGRQLIGFDAGASQAIQQFSWPGNLRQMKNLIKKATLLATGNMITCRELKDDLQESSEPVTLSLKEDEKTRILNMLKRTGNNKSRTAQLLGIDRKTLYNKLRSYGIDL